jgi:hypothetical protein
VSIKGTKLTGYPQKASLVMAHFGATPMLGATAGRMMQGR